MSVSTPEQVPDHHALQALLNRALIAQSAVDSEKQALAREEQGLQAAVQELEIALMAAGLRGVTSLLGEAQFGKKVVYNCEDWEKLNKHIKDTGEFDILQRRLSSTAVRDRASNGELPPGVRQVTLDVLKLSVK